MTRNTGLCTMPHHIPVTKMELDSAPNIIYDSPNSSNREPSVSTNDEGEYFSRCRWFGEEYFRFSLEMAIFKNAKGYASADDLKLELTQIGIDFPYMDCIEKLDAVKATKIPEAGNGEKPKPYTTFVTKLGAVVDKVDYESRNRLTFMIQQQGGLNPASTNADNAMLSSSPPPGDDSIGSDKTIALCSTKLHEWAAEKQKSMSWKGKQVSLDPPLNKVTVLVDGEKFVAAAKKQNMAKHIACKEACERFGIMD